MSLNCITSDEDLNSHNELFSLAVQIYNKIRFGDKSECDVMYRGGQRLGSRVQSSAPDTLISSAGFIEGFATYFYFYGLCFYWNGA